jgi:hypothetical protein
MEIVGRETIYRIGRIVFHPIRMVATVNSAASRIVPT